MDLRAAVEEPVTLAPGEFRPIPTGIRIALPAGYEGQVRPRSGLAAKHGVTILNAPGTIDADYRGEVRVILINHGREPFVIGRGERIAQLLIAPVCRAEWNGWRCWTKPCGARGGLGIRGGRTRPGRLSVESGEWRGPGR